MSAITAALADAAHKRPHQAALFLPSGPSGQGAAGWHTVTNAQLAARANAIAEGLTSSGLSPGERAAVFVPPTADFFALTFGLLLAGIVPVLIDPGIGPKHIKGCLAESEPDAFIGIPRAHGARIVLRWAPTARHLVVVTPPKLPAFARVRLSRRSSRLRTLTAVEAGGWSGPASGRAPGDGFGGAGTLDTPDVAAVLFTSGSTGPPKGVEYTHENFAAQIAALRELYDLGPADVHLATFPPFALFGPALGMPTVIPRMDPTRPADVDPPDILEALRSFDATVMFGSPALLDTVSSWAVARGVGLQGLRLVMSAGAPVSQRIVKAMTAVLDPDARLVTPYGATEALPVASVDHRELSSRPSHDPPLGVCVGRPAPGIDLAIARITNDAIANLADEDVLGAGEMGEIVVSGGVVTRSYLARPQATAAAKTTLRGLLAHRMGDVGVIDADGWLWFCGRKAHLIWTASGPVAPVPVEVTFNAIDWVHRSALIGLGSPGAQQLGLCVELGPDAPDPVEAVAQLFSVAATHPHTRGVQQIRIHPGFPVDIRHNAKINYDALAAWWQQS